MDSLRDEKEVLIYVHLPFCFSQCIFCNSFPHEADPGLQKEYLDSLIRDIEIFSASGVFAGKQAKCIYFGGGTPTTFSNEDIRSVLHAIGASLDMSEIRNVTLEAHPETLADPGRIEELADLGINRISMGCQSFDPEVLRLCRRANSESVIEGIVSHAQAIGIAANIDMMIGLPGQTVAGVERDLIILDRVKPNAIEYIRHEIVNPSVISLYNEHPDLLVSDDELFEMICLTQQYMEERSYEQNGRFTSDRHFPYRYYWIKGIPILAFGSRTRSYTKTTSYDKHEELTSYSRLSRKGVPPIGRYVHLTKQEQMLRSLFLNIQVIEGLSLDEFQATFQENALDIFSSLLEKARECGCIQTDDKSIRLTKHGRYFVEDVCCLIIDYALQEYHTPQERTPHSWTYVSSRLEPGKQHKNLTDA
jgi:oxygen-independent coproporphyrinogen-3 oxidase